MFNAARARRGYYQTISQVNPIRATPDQEQATQPSPEVEQAWRELVLPVVLDQQVDSD